MCSMQEVCKSGDMEKVRDILMDTAHVVYTYNSGLVGACEGGHMEIVMLMLERGADNYDHGLDYACERGHMEIVKLMLEKGATYYNWGLVGACESGHMEIVKLMLERGATVYNGSLEGACRGSHRHIVLFLLEYTTSEDIPKSYTFTQDEVACIYHKGVAHNLTRVQDKEALQEYLAWRDSAKRHVDTVLYPDLSRVVMTYL